MTTETLTGPDRTLQRIQGLGVANAILDGTVDMRNLSEHLRDLAATAVADALQSSAELYLMQTEHLMHGDVEF